MCFPDMEFSWILWRESGKFYSSQDIGLPLGCIAAVHAWHRVAALVTVFIKRILLAPCLRYVDDFLERARLRCIGLQVVVWISCATFWACR